MKFILNILIFAIFLKGSIQYPTKSSIELKENEYEEGDLFEGDIILNSIQSNAIFYPQARNGLVKESFRWPNNVVYVELDKVFKEDHKDYIWKGLKMIEEKTCIHFEPRTEKQDAYIYVTGIPGSCHSEIGYQGKKQILNLAITPLNTACFRLGTIVHEFFHALGFYHQQSTYDRDSFVKIVEQNVRDGKLDNFKKYNNTEVTDFGISYDYGSLMHYSTIAFSRNGQPTIIPLNETAVIGQRDGMSDKDIMKLNLMYKCL